MNQVSEISSLVNIQPLDDVSNVEFSNKIEYQQHNTLESRGHLVTLLPNICGLASTDFLFLLSLASWTNF